MTTTSSPSKILSNAAWISAATLLFLWLFSTAVPFQMDEFSQFHALACRYYPLNSLNTFRESCSQYELAPFGSTFLPLRSCWHIGSITSLLYLPLFELWRSPYSARLLGLLYLAAQACILGRLFFADQRWIYILLLAFMPYAFQHAVDTGTVAFQATLIMLIIYWARQWRKSFGRPKDRYPFLIGLALFAGIWAKVSFLAALPAILAAVAWELFAAKDSPRLSAGRLLRGLAILAVSAALPLHLLLSSMEHFGRPYYYYFQIKASRWPAWPSPSVFRYFLDPSSGAHLVFRVPDRPFTWEGLALWFLILSALIAGSVALKKKKLEASPVTVYFGLAAVTFLILAFHRSSYAMHHTFLAYPFLVLALGHALAAFKGSRFFWVWTAAFITVNAFAYTELPRLQPKPFNDPGNAEITRVLTHRFSKDHVIVVIDWGLYFTQSLYGDKNQCVLFVLPLDRQSQIDEIRAIARRLGRKIVFVGWNRSKSDLKLIQKNFPNCSELNFQTDADLWRVWVEPGGAQ